MSQANSFLDGFMRGYSFMDQRKETKRRREREDMTFNQSQADRSRRIEREDEQWGIALQDRERNISRQDRADQRDDQRFEWERENREIAAEDRTYTREREARIDSETSAFRGAQVTGLRLGNQKMRREMEQSQRLQDVTRQLYRLESTRRAPEKVGVVVDVFQRSPEQAVQSAAVLQGAFNPDTPFPENPAAVRQAVSTLMPDIIKRAVGKPARGGGTVADVQFRGMIRDDEQIAIELEVTKDDGSRYVAPLTMNGTSSDQDNLFTTDDATLTREVMGRIKLVEAMQQGADPQAIMAELKAAFDSEQMQGVMQQRQELEAEYVSLSGRRWGEPDEDQNIAVGGSLVNRRTGETVWAKPEKPAAKPKLGNDEAKTITRAVMDQYELPPTAASRIQSFVLQQSREPTQEEVQAMFPRQVSEQQPQRATGRGDTKRAQELVRQIPGWSD